ncbi:MAG TPA: sigma-70 family RNA polymerase sigma factor [Croceibacterium sp.]|nr:sigma-70 family RNA polymerase sigma factor [Croceibacterium sp.]
MISTQRSASARAYRDSIAEIVERFMPMVRKLAWHLQGSAMPGIDPEDLTQAGLVALTECAQRHAGNDMEGFAAYAKIRVKGAMVDQLRRFAPISRGAAQRRRELQDFERRLRGQLGRDPSDFELAAAMGITSAELDAIRTACAPLKFEPVDNTYSDNDAAFWDQAPSAIENLISAEDREGLAAAVGELPERLQLVIQLYFVEELNLAEIASVLGLSVPRIYQLKDQALRKIRERLGSDLAAQ